jgi:hypothetical protein
MKGLSGCVTEDVCERAMLSKLAKQGTITSHQSLHYSAATVDCCFSLGVKSNLSSTRSPDFDRISPSTEHNIHAAWLRGYDRAYFVLWAPQGRSGEHRGIKEPHPRAQVIAHMHPSSHTRFSSGASRSLCTDWAYRVCGIRSTYKVRWRIVQTDTPAVPS